MSTDGYTKKSKHPSVTHILSPYSGYDRIHPMHLGKAAERGTIVHSHCASIALGEWRPSPIPEYRGYVKSFRQWFDVYVDDALLVEAELEDNELGYCGHPDLVVQSEKLGGVILIDLKTPVSVHRKVWGAQLVAYQRMIEKAEGIVCQRIGSLRLKKDGAMAVFDDFTGNAVACWAAFYGALIATKFFGNN